MTDPERHDEPSAGPHTVEEPIPSTVTITQLLRILQISRPTFYRHWKRGDLPVQEILPRTVRGPRFSGASLKAYLSHGHKAERRRA